MVAVLAYIAALAGDELGSFFSVAAQVSIGLLIAIAVEVRRARPQDDLEAALQMMGLLNVLLGVISGLTGTLVSREQEVPVAAVFGVSWGGLVAGFTSLVFIVGAGQRRTVPNG